MNQISVLLADDHMMFREGLRALLNLEPGIKVVAEARHGRQAVAMAQEHKPDVIVMDLAMPELNGLGACRQILAALPGTKIIVLSAYSEEAYIRSVLSTGAVGFLIKQASAESLAKAIRLVHAGQTFFSPARVKQVAAAAVKAPKAKGAKIDAVLTAREMEVIQLVAEGSSNKEVASHLKISVKTVEKHRQHLMDKLDIHDTAGLTRYAIAHGIIEGGVMVTIV
jgi:DNA-binding NarL/FixJ family response regulator